MDSSQLQTPVGDQVTSSVRFLPRVSSIQAGLQLLSVGKGVWLSKGVAHVCFDLLRCHAGRSGFHLVLQCVSDVCRPSTTCTHRGRRVSSVIRSGPDRR